MTLFNCSIIKVLFFMEEQDPDKRCYELADKWARGTISEEEKREYAAWYNRIDPAYELEVPLDHATSKEVHKAILLQNIRQKLQLEKPPFMEGHRRKRILVKVAIAATLLLFVGAGVFWAIQTKPDNTDMLADINESGKSIDQVDHFGAILTLSDGTKMDLDAIAEGDRITEGHSSARKQDNTLSYLADSMTTKKAAARVDYNTMTTARGKEYSLVLPDGTKVWLNAASSITYPTSFAGSDRTVSLEGEAYFEVFKDKGHPFKVKTAYTTVKVLGTHFDVMAYSDESMIKTTLLEGSVEISNASSQKVTIKPGQAASVHPGAAAITVETVEAQHAIGWVKGKLSLNDLDLESLMRRVSRWYNVDVRFEGKAPSVKFWGVINRNASLDDVLEVIKENGVHIRHQGNIIIISDK